MLSIGKLGKGQQAYYLDRVASGAEDYYAGAGESPGQWTGSAASQLELAGEVERGQLDHLLSGLDPRSDCKLPAYIRSDRVPGFDVTFSAPKSVSLVWALGDRETSQAVRGAHERSVEEALGYLEREAAFTRLGADGVNPTRGTGFVAAAFPHRMSRAGDPQLHTHVLVANLIRTQDGEWKALDAQRLYRRAKTAGYLYQAHLRAELTRELGVEFSAVRRGAAEIARVPDETLRAFSRRRAEIEARMAEVGGASRRSAEVAARETRTPKDRSLSLAEQRREWAETARETGFKVGRVLGARELSDQPLDEPKLFADIERSLTVDQSAFARRHVIEQIAACDSHGKHVGEVERLVDRFLARPEVVELGAARPPNASQAAPTEPLYTTSEVLAIEEALIATAERQAQLTLLQADLAAVETALARDLSLASEQREMVERLALGGEGTVVVVGRAGAGKTRALRPVREAFEASGYPVVGASVQNSAARILGQEAGITSTSLTRLLYDADKSGARLPTRSVLVVDEAGMASTRQLAGLQKICVRDEVKLVLVGDPEQLPAIEHPGAFRALCDRLDPVELTETRRLADPVERELVERVRAGHGRSALEVYDARGRLTFADTSADLDTVIVADRHAAQQESKDALILTRARASARRLNELAQEVRVQDGELGAESIEVGETLIRAGDHVVTRANRPGQEPVHNRERWLVEQIDAERRAMTLRHLNEPDRVVTLDASYLDREVASASGAIELGYATTKHGAQGMTVDRAFVALTDGLSKEDAYVALTRAREETRLYAVAREPIERSEIAPGPEARDVTTDGLGRAIERSEQQALAIDERLRAELEARSTEELLAERRRLEGEADDPASRRLEKTRRLRENGEQKLAAFERGGAEGAPRLWGGGRDLTGIQVEMARDQIERLRAQEQELASKARPQTSADRERQAAVGRVLRERRQLATEAAIRLEPRYITEAIGPRPEGIRERLRWDESVERIEELRQDLGVRDRQRVLGREPRDRSARLDWRRADRELRRMQEKLLSREMKRELGRVRGAGMGRGR